MRGRVSLTHGPGMSVLYCNEAKKIPDKWFMVAAITVAQSLDDKDMEATPFDSGSRIFSSIFLNKCSSI